jgi:hypothetical protein
MHLPMNVKSPNNIKKWQMGFNSEFKGLTNIFYVKLFNKSKNYSFSEFVQVIRRKRILPICRLLFYVINVCQSSDMERRVR